MSAVGQLHARMVFERRTRILSDALIAALPPDCASILDVGCGDGTISRMVMEGRPSLSVTGVDVLVRDATHIPVIKFDGTHLPFPDQSFDVVMFVDVLHHTDDPSTLLKEARRVARKAVVLKDHSRDSLLAGPILRFMDWVGNAHHGVVLPYNYWSTGQWRNTFRLIGLNPETWNPTHGLYPFPANLVFERALHFVSRLRPIPAASGT